VKTSFKDGYQTSHGVSDYGNATYEGRGGGKARGVEDIEVAFLSTSRAGGKQSAIDKNRTLPSKVGPGVGIRMLQGRN